MQRASLARTLAAAVVWLTAADVWSSSAVAADHSPPTCRPVDGAWALAVHATDSATGAPIVGVSAMIQAANAGAATDSAGWFCVRTLRPGGTWLDLWRRGYRNTTLEVSGVLGQLAVRELRLVRLPNPCCDVRGRWRIAFTLVRKGAMSPAPTARTIAGELALGPHVLPPQEGDDEDSLVRVVRGLHHVDFTPFFGGPVAPDVSRSIFGSGPDLLHEVEASVPAGDSVDVTFIPRMSHGSLSLTGRIRGDTVRGTWVQNAFADGATGTWEMTRVGTVDTTPLAGPPAPSVFRRMRQKDGAPPEWVPAGSAPDGRWRPELAVAPDGRLWLAVGGLYVADAFAAPWHRVLGGDADPVSADELRRGIDFAFVGRDSVLVGLEMRFPMEGAPVLYRSTDRGASWASVRLPGARDVEAFATFGHSVWMAINRAGTSNVLLSSHDGGRSWTVLPPLPRVRGVAGIYRTSDSTAFLYSHEAPGTPARWRTRDGGQHWSALPTPSDQGLQKLRRYDTRIEELATVGSWLLVREHGRVFSSAAAAIEWHALPHIEHIAAEPGRAHAFVLSDSLRPGLLDRDLRLVWQGDRPLPVRDPGDIEHVRVHDDVGYVSEIHGEVHEVRAGNARVIRPESR